MGYTRLRDLRRMLLLSVLAALVLTQLHSGQPASDERIVINVAERTLIIVKDDNPVATYPIAVGKPETPTPTGAFRVLKLDPHPASRTGMLGTRWIEFSRTKMANGRWFLYGIHGTNEPSKIGQAVSHGCIRLSNEDIEEVFRRAYIGETVTIMDSPGKSVP